MAFKWWAAAPVALALSACGGGGGELPGSGGIVTVIPPTPTPSPPPSPSYQSARDFSQDRSAQDFGARIETFQPFGLPVKPKRVLSSATTTTLGAIGFSYNAASRSYRVNYFSETRDFVRIQTFDQTGYSGDSDFNLSDPSPYHRYFRLVYNDSTTPAYNLQYVGISVWRDITTSDRDSGDVGQREIQRYQLYGAHTVGTDLPTTGTSTFPLYFPLIKGTFDVQIDWASGVISGVARAACEQGEACPSGDVGEVKLNGSFDGSFRILGSISGGAGYTGTFVGGFYGPRALEIGIVGDYRHATREPNIFFATGRRR